MNRAVLAAGNPEGDLLFGVDNTLLSRLSAAGAIDGYQAPADFMRAADAELFRAKSEGRNRVCAREIA